MFAIEKTAFGICANGFDSYESNNERMYQRRLQNQHFKNNKEETLMPMTYY